MALRLWTRVRRSLFRRAQDDQDLDDELRFHLAQETRLRAERGAAPAEAERAARIALGSLTRTREDTRAVWVSTRFEQLLQDLRAGSRIVSRSPGLTLAAVVLVALVIGGNTTIFSIVHAILNKPAPGVTAGNLVTLTWTEPPDWIEPEVDYATYRDLRAQARSVRLVGSFPDRMCSSPRRNLPVRASKSPFTSAIRNRWTSPSPPFTGRFGTSTRAYRWRQWRRWTHGSPRSCGR